jgi:hypothetical protein
MAVVGGRSSVPGNRAVNHEVVAVQSPRLLYSATLGTSGNEARNPKGLRHSSGETR